MKKLLFLLIVLCVSCSTTRNVLMLNKKRLGETKLDVVELRKENICFNNELLGLLNQLPSNLNDEVYILTIRKYKKKDYIIIQNWGIEILKSTHYSYWGVYSLSPLKLFLLCYDNEKSHEELKKKFSKIGKCEEIPLAKKVETSNEYIHIYEDVTTYLMGEMSGGHIVVKKMIINNHVMKTS